MAKKTKIAKDVTELVSLIKKDLADWNQEAHPDDRLSYMDWLGEMMGPQPIYGYRVVRNGDGFSFVRVVN